MRVLWLCNCPLSDSDMKGTGTWLDAMARGLLNFGTVELGIIALSSVMKFTRSDYRQVKQWLVPSNVTLGRSGLPPQSLIDSIVAAVNEFSPDMLHVWGTESFWGLLTARGVLKYPTLLEIQGLRSETAKGYFGGLTMREQFKCIGLKELIKLRSMHSVRHELVRGGLRGEEIIRGHMLIDVQSLWVVSHIKAINPKACLFPVDLALRDPFYDADGWKWLDVHTVFCTAAYTTPSKGLHVAVRALALLKKQIPDVRLRIAGFHQRPGIRQEGYMRWLNRMIRNLGLSESIDWLGPLNAEQIVAELKNAAAVVIPTFVETYCMAFAEAMSIGTPAVVSYTGGTAHLGKDEDSCIFFPPGDEAMCAYHLERILTDQKFSHKLSSKARAIASIRNNPETVVRNQMGIYRRVHENKGG